MAEATGIQLVISPEAESEAPLCPHGPTLLFAKINRKKKEARRFYACAACRDRKDCNFFQWENEKVSLTRQLARKEFNQSRQPPFTHKQYVERLHELIKLHQFEKNSPVIKSQLLDIDFSWITMLRNFGGHPRRSSICQSPFLLTVSKALVRSTKSAFEASQTFLCQENGESVIMVTDPPFGGLVEALAHSFKKIVAMWKTSQNKDEELPIFWIFPYFFEARILQCFPTFSMLDYQVDYDNHTLYKHGNSGRKQSPVRIFTNLSPKSIILPAEEGYRYCSLCQRYISSANRHCEICQACTSKDGREWKHCHICNKCVKPSWYHCDTCSRCALQDHSCETAGSGCFICGSAEHKRRECLKVAFQNKIIKKSKSRKQKYLEKNKEGAGNKSKQGRGSRRGKSKRKLKKKNKQ
ncbi:rRNA N6-adenosine-methyltransferase ZCCHC4 isoform X3 [Narcine bancroftii]|uniref:rRNA N6-adenosine-methyltransferase ZCCHC4 isoform X3 n=1 Tax=Narcine bancroftii TaxID=1343680 RepID=UPI003831F67B